MSSVCATWSNYVIVRRHWQSLQSVSVFGSHIIDLKEPQKQQQPLSAHGDPWKDWMTALETHWLSLLHVHFATFVHPQAFLGITLMITGCALAPIAWLCEPLGWSGLGGSNYFRFYKKPYDPVREQVWECGRRPPPLNINVLWSKISNDESHVNDNYCISALYFDFNQTVLLSLNTGYCNKHRVTEERVGLVNLWCCIKRFRFGSSGLFWVAAIISTPLIYFYAQQSTLKLHYVVMYVRVWWVYY